LRYRAQRLLVTLGLRQQPQARQTAFQLLHPRMVQQRHLFLYMLGAHILHHSPHLHEHGLRLHHLLPQRLARRAQPLQRQLLRAAQRSVHLLGRL
jgi:hypothetical protein